MLIAGDKHFPVLSEISIVPFNDARRQAQQHLRALNLSGASLGQGTEYQHESKNQIQPKI
jgi:hypothetical protein